MEHVNLTLEPGERVGLTAPSGPGQDHPVQAPGGYERSTAGEVLLDGRPLSQYRGACPVQMIWQHPETVLDPLLPLEVSLKEAGPVVERLLEELHIQPQWLRRYPQELSGGELQRFCIARALGRATRYLLCDEITAMLDPHYPGQIRDFLLREAERAESEGLLIVSHNAPLLSGCAPGWRFSLPLRKKRRPSLDLELHSRVYDGAADRGVHFSRFYFQEVLSQ